MPPKPASQGRRPWRLPYRRVRVVGDSMLPGLIGGQVVLVRQWGRPCRLAAPGAVVLVEDPRLRSRLMVKRVRSNEGGKLALHGDNAAHSTDSRHFGAVPLDHVRGRVRDRALWSGPVRWG